MYHSKKIALFISHIYGNYQKEVCQGVVDCAWEYGFQTEIYTTSDGEDLGKYSLGEASILRIPVFSQLFGVIIASGTYPEQALKDQILSVLKESCDCPIIEISEQPSSFPTISLENSLTAGLLTEHLIRVHHLERICYLGCDKESLFSLKREKAYREAMTKHGLPIPPSAVKSCGYTLPQVQEALEAMSVSQPPQAVVCYNDRMALLLMAAALKKGLRIPQDLAVTGCDATEEGKHALPPLTTVSFPTYQVGEAAVHQLIRLSRKETVPDVTTVFAKPLMGGSCGCQCPVPENPLIYSHAMEARIQGLETSILTSMRMSAEFSHAGDIDEGMDILEKYVNRIPGCREFYLCLYGNWDLPPQHIQDLTPTLAVPGLSEEEVLLKLAVKDKKRLPECSFSRKKLLPDFLYKDSSHAPIITPLFFEDQEFGYLVLSFQDDRIDYHFQLVHWVMNITQFLKSLLDQKGAALMRRELESIYTKDSLTGFLSHHGLRYYLPSFLAQKDPADMVTVLLFDADCLKTVNDSYGRQEGDLALKAIGEILMKATLESRKEPLCVRLRGDQFLLLLLGDQAECSLLLSRIDRYLKNYNALSTRPYSLFVTSASASRPASRCQSLSELQELIREADGAMYQKKRPKETTASQPPYSS